MNATPKGDTSRVLSNTLFNLGSSTVLRALAFAYGIYVIHALGKADYGTYSYVRSILNILIIFSELGLSRLITREIARRHRDFRILLRRYSPLKVGGAALTVGGLVLYSVIFREPESVVGLMRLFLVLFLAQSYYGLIVAGIQGLERMGVTSGMNVLQRSLSLVFGATTLMWGGGLYDLAAALTAASVLTLICGVVIALKLSLPEALLSQTEKADSPLHMAAESRSPFSYGKTLKEAIPFGAGSLVVRIFGQFDTVFMAKYFTSRIGQDAAMTIVGIYNSSYSLIAQLGFLAGALHEAVFPVFSRRYEEEKGQREALRRAAERTLRYGFLIGVPMATGLTVLATPIVDLAYGFTEGALVLQIQAWVIALTFGSFIFTGMLNSLDRQTWTLGVMTSAMLVNVVSNIILIPSFGMTGAAISLCMTEVTVFCSSWFLCSKLVKDLRVLPYLIHSGIGSLAMAFLLTMTDSLHVLIRIVLGMVFYAAALLA